MSDPVLLEICVDSMESALAAEQGGAHRIELCASLVEGGVTPSAGLISTVRSRVHLDTYVMIRPRGGDFCYSQDEFEVMEKDVITAKQLGADGIVLGILLENGHVDVPRTRHLINLARPLRATFHRAIDMSCDLEQSLNDIIAAGADRVLTSGGEQRVEEGLSSVLRLRQIAKGRIGIIAGAGITESNVRRVLTGTGVREIHASVRVHVSSPMRHRNDRLDMGVVRGREYERIVVMQDKVRRLLEAARDGIRPVVENP